MDFTPIPQSNIFSSNSSVVTRAIESLYGNGIEYLAIIGGAVVTGMIIWGGITYMGGISQSVGEGDSKKKVGLAKKIITEAFIGAIIIMSAILLVSIGQSLSTIPSKVLQPTNGEIKFLDSTTTRTSPPVSPGDTVDRGGGCDLNTGLCLDSPDMTCTIDGDCRL